MSALSELEHIYRGWHHCRNCDAHFRAARPQLGIYYLCPTCEKLDLRELAAKFESDRLALLAEVRAKYQMKEPQ
jgi:sarcosine oxidase delta subunit